MDNRKVFIAGHLGMVGSAIERIISKDSKINIIRRSRKELDLINQSAVREFFKAERIDEVYLAAAKVGGIYANSRYPADFIYENIMIETNVIDAAFQSGVKKLLFLGSSCIYPKSAAQPILENALLTGPLESTNEPYAIAKIVGIKLCESYNRQYGKSDEIDFRTVMPCNLYGPGDNYHPQNSHVIPALLRKFHEAKINNLESVTIWGTGNPRREFLHVDDLASASVQIMNTDKLIDEVKSIPPSHVNVGFGSDVTIKNLADIIQEVTSYEGQIKFDVSQPDGTFQKLLDSSLMRNLGWRPQIDLKDGLAHTYLDFQNHYQTRG